MSILIGGAIYYMARPSYPTSVLMYRYRYKQMMSTEMKEGLINFTNQFHPIEGLDYIKLLTWEHVHLAYYEYALNERPELPIPIIKHGKGRCG